MPASLPFAATLASALFLAAAARAEITADQLWAAWQAGATRSGQTITAAGITRSGNALRLDAVTLTATQPGASTRTRLDWIVLEETGDGRVRVGIAPEARVSGSFTDARGETARLDATLRLDRAGIVASGTPDELVQILTAERITLEGLSVAGAGGVVSPGTATGHLSQVKTRYVSMPSGPDRMSVAGSASAKQARLAVRAENPADGARIALDVALDDLAWRFDNMLAAVPEDGNPLRAGVRVALDVTYSTALSRIEADSAAGGGRMRVETQSGAGAVSVGLDAGTLRYAATAGAVGYALAAPDLPFDALTAEIGTAEVKLQLPLGPVGGTGDFSLGIGLRDVVPGPEVWTLIDPLGGLDRGPGRLELALSGRLRILGDMLAQAAPGMAGALAGASPPAELAALTLERLALTAAGAGVTGNGALDFPPGAPELATGVRAAEGQLRFTFTGADALLEKLGKLGIVPENQVMGLRMMLAMFTVPGPEPESMVVELAFTPEGRILANGEPLN